MQEDVDEDTDWDAVGPGEKFASQLSHFCSEHFFTQKKKTELRWRKFFRFSRTPLIVFLRWKGHTKKKFLKEEKKKKEKISKSEKDLTEDALILLSPFVVWREEKKIISAKKFYIRDKNQSASVIRWCWQLQHQSFFNDGSNYGIGFSGITVFLKLFLPSWRKPD